MHFSMLIGTTYSHLSLLLFKIWGNGGSFGTDMGNLHFFGVLGFNSLIPRLKDIIIFLAYLYFCQAYNIDTSP